MEETKINSEFLLENNRKRSLARPECNWRIMCNYIVGGKFDSTKSR